MAFSATDYNAWLALAEGGEAEVFRARQKSLERWVAVKRLKLSRAEPEKDIQRFERAAKLSASLKHVNLVPIYDYGMDGGYYHLVMDFVPGVEMHLCPGLSAATKLHVAKQVIDVIQFIHGQGILHRDLKPSNFLIDIEGNVKLLDLGLAKAAHLETITEDRFLLRGTLPYFPPEIFQGQAEFNAKAEYYSLALLLLEFFIERRVFAPGPMSELVTKIQTGINWREINLGSDLQQVLRPYLLTNPAHRPDDLEILLRFFLEASATYDSPDRDLLLISQKADQFLQEAIWSECGKCEKEKRWEAAYILIKNRIDENPLDGKAIQHLQFLAQKLNESAAIESVSMSRSSVPKHNKLWKKSNVIIRKISFSRENILPWIMVVLVPIFLFLLTNQWNVNNQKKLQPDLGALVAKREKSQQFRELRFEASKASTGEIKPSGNPSHPYGQVTLSGLAENYKVYIDSIPVSMGVHTLPMGKHSIWVLDSRGQECFRDSLLLNSAEPFKINLAQKIRPEGLR